MRPKTASKRQQTKQAYCEEVVQRLGQGDYRVIGKYLNQDTYLSFIHLTCQRPFSATLSQFQSGKRCPHCEG